MAFNCIICLRWLSSVDAKPGLNQMMLDMLERRRQEDEAKYGCVTLMLDAMAIKKHVQYVPQTQTMSGFVDMGDRSNQTDIATEALVFMVVGVQGYWKAPIAYYLTKTLTPETQKVLVVHALEELHKRQIKVVCMTMDGHASNISMCNQLGCELKANPSEPMKTYFLHPVTQDQVFVMMDACHMLKLTRNMLEVHDYCLFALVDSTLLKICFYCMELEYVYHTVEYGALQHVLAVKRILILQAYSPIRSSTGCIEWRYIVDLNNVQKGCGLHAANRVTDKHVHFANQKMKVCLYDDLQYVLRL